MDRDDEDTVFPAQVVALSRAPWERKLPAQHLPLPEAVFHAWTEKTDKVSD